MIATKQTFLDIFVAYQTYIANVRQYNRKVAFRMAHAVRNLDRELFILEHVHCR